MFTKIFSIGSLIAGIIGIILGIVFIMKSDDNKLVYNIDVSSILSIISVVFNLVGIIVIYLLSNKTFQRLLILNLTILLIFIFFLLLFFKQINFILIKL